MPSWLDLLMGGQAPVFPQGQQQPAPPFVPQQMAIAPTFAQAPQMAQDVAAGIADPLLKAGNYLGGIMQGSQQFSWPETIQHGAALAMALAPGPGRAGEAAGALERGAAGVAKGAAEIAPTGIRAFHGSPYDFPAFDLSKIGTGEGAQAYGHGLYFAENEATAKAYRDAVKNMPALDAANQRMTEIAREMDTLRKPGTYREFTDPRGYQLADEYDQLMASKMAPGKMYEVNIKAQPEQFLDWEKPFSEQSPQVQKAITDLWTAKGGKLEGRDKPPFVASTDTGEAIHAALATTYGRGGNDAAAATQALHDAGVSGIRYRDQLSRNPVNAINQHLFKPYGGELDLPKPTHNYVVFNDQLIDIMRKYGLIGALGGSMSAPYFAPQGQQQ